MEETAGRECPPGLAQARCSANRAPPLPGCSCCLLDTSVSCSSHPPAYPSIHLSIIHPTTHYPSIPLSIRHLSIGPPFTCSSLIQKQGRKKAANRGDSTALSPRVCVCVCVGVGVGVGVGGEQAKKWRKIPPSVLTLPTSPSPPLALESHRVKGQRSLTGLGVTRCPDSFTEWALS